MTGAPNPRAVIGRALMVSAIVMFVVAIAFATGLLPLDPGVRGTVAGLIAVVAVVDLLIGFWFLRRTS